MNTLQITVASVSLGLLVVGIYVWQGSSTPDSYTPTETQLPPSSNEQQTIAVEIKPESGRSTRNLPKESNLTTKQHLERPAQARGLNTTIETMDEEQQEFVNQLVDNFPLNEQGKIDYNNTTKNYLNIAYNALLFQEEKGNFDEVSLGVITERLEQTLPAGVINEAVGLMENYFSYRKAEQSLLIPGLNSEELLSMFTQSAQLRRAYLGEDIANGLFSEEEQMTRHLIRKRILSEDPNLSEEEIQAKDKEIQTAFNRAFPGVVLESYQDSTPTKSAQ